MVSKYIILCDVCDIIHKIDLRFEKIEVYGTYIHFFVSFACLVSSLPYQPAFKKTVLARDDMEATLEFSHEKQAAWVSLDSVE